MPKERLRGLQFPSARAHLPEGIGGPIQVVVGAQGGTAGGSSSQGPGTPTLGGRGVLPRLQSVLMEGPRGVAVPIGPGTPARRGRESYSGGGRCSRRACEGYQFPMARAHQPGGTGSPAQVVVGAHGGPTRGSDSHGPGHTSPGGAGSSTQAVVGAQGGPARGISSQWPGHPSPGGRGALPRWWWVLRVGLWGVAVPNGPGTPSRGDVEYCPGGGRCSRRPCGG